MLAPDEAPEDGSPGGLDAPSPVAADADADADVDADGSFLLSLP